MTNELKDIFSVDDPTLISRISFKNDEAVKTFLNALKIAHTEGHAVSVDGITSITLEFTHHGSILPFKNFTKIKEFSISAASQPITIPITVNSITKDITLLRSQENDRIILRSEPESIIALCFTYFLQENKLAFNYSVHLEKAKTIKELVDASDIMVAILSHLTNNENELPNEIDIVSDIKKQLHHDILFLERLHAIETEFDFQIPPTSLTDLTYEDRQAIDEIYLLLCKKEVVRINAELSSAYSTMKPLKNNSSQPIIGANIKLHFLGDQDFYFLDKKIKLYTANLLLNAFIKDIKENSDGTLKVFFDGTDSNPMYISLAAFKTSKEAKEELECIVNKESSYINASTSDALIKEFYPIIP